MLFGGTALFLAFPGDIAVLIDFVLVLIGDFKVIVGHIPVSEAWIPSEQFLRLLSQQVLDFNGIGFKEIQGSVDILQFKVELVEVSAPGVVGMLF